MSRGSQARSTARSARYHIFVLSLWEESGRLAGDGPTWRYSLEGTDAAGRRGFKDLADLAAYLETWTQNWSDSPSPVHGHGIYPSISQSVEKELPMPMSINRSTPTPVVLPPGAGETHSVGDISVTFKTTGRQSGGQFTVLEATELPGSGSPTQWHKATTLILYVLEGTLTLRIGDETIQAGPGGYAYVPPGTVYAIANQGGAPMRYLMVHSPAWIEDYIAEGIQLMEGESSWPPADMSKLLAMRAKYDVFDPPVS